MRIEDEFANIMGDNCADGGKVKNRGPNNIIVHSYIEVAADNSK